MKMSFQHACAAGGGKGVPLGIGSIAHGIVPGLAGLFLLSLQVKAESPYAAWLKGFESRLVVGALLEQREIQAIESDLLVKPEGQPTDYDTWMRSLNVKLQIGATVDTTEEQVLIYMLRAKPSNNASRYPVYLAELDKRLRRVGAILDDAERFVFKRILLPARPESAEPADYPAFQLEWQRRYQSLSGHFRTLDATEQKLLAYFRTALPYQSGSAANQPADTDVTEDLDRLLKHGPTKISRTVADDEYRRASAMLDIMDALHRQLEEDVRLTGDPQLKRLLKRMESRP